MNGYLLGILDIFRLMEIPKLHCAGHAMRIHKIYKRKNIEI